jgi:hypothetical protein
VLSVALCLVSLRTDRGVECDAGDEPVLVREAEKCSSEI